MLTASFVISQVVAGLGKYFPDLASVIFVSDGNSVDGTLESVRTVHLPCTTIDACNPSLIPAVYVGIPGKGSALRAIFEAARILDVKAVALVDSDLRSITPEWMSLLISPILTGTGMVTPLYNRRKYDGTITDFLCYPVTASLYGKDIRQPIGGDFGLSISLIDALLSSSLWDKPEVRRFGVDIFETHTALANGLEVKQAFLGAKDHDQKDPLKQLTPMFRQVVSTMFNCVEVYEKAWKPIRGISKVETVGAENHSDLQKPVQVDPHNMMLAYKKEYDEYSSLYKGVLADDLLQIFEKARKIEDIAEPFPLEAWAKTVFSFVAAFHKADNFHRERLVDALRVLWTGRLASFVKETENLSPQETESKIVAQARVFEQIKPYLIDLCWPIKLSK